MIAVKAKQRGVDAWGSGGWHASRKRADGTRYKHQGIDYAAEPGQLVLSDVAGVVSRIGFPYPPEDKLRGHLRYIEIHIKSQGGFLVRYFYVKPDSRPGGPYGLIGEDVRPGSVLGVAADLTGIYPGIANHYHLEVMDAQKVHINPEDFLKAYNS